MNCWIFAKISFVKLIIFELNHYAKNDFILFLIVSRIKTALHTLLYGRLSYFRTYLVHSPCNCLFEKVLS